eukprot:11830659-Ditylum_brightwellii.AAC.1
MRWIELCNGPVYILHSDGGQPAKLHEDYCRDGLEDCQAMTTCTSNIFDCMIGFGIDREGEYIVFPFHLHAKEREQVIIDDFYLI